MQDESIFTYDVKIRKVWAVKGSKPIVLSTGSKRKSVVFGAVAEGGAQLFRQYPIANSDYFLLFLKELVRKFPRMIFFMDKAPWHTEYRVKRFLRKNRFNLKVIFFPKGYPEANPMEECWNEGKDSILGSTFYNSFAEFKLAISNYYRTKKFSHDLYKYLCH